MNCTDFQDGLMRTTGTLDEALAAHAAGCAGCQALLQAETALRNRLRELSPLRPTPAFEERLAQAFARRRPTRFRPGVAYALAASLMAAVLIPALWLGTPAPVPQDTDVTTAATAPVITRTVRLAFKAPRDLEGVQIRIELPEGVTLSDRPGTRTLAWTTDLNQGNNLLEFAVSGTSAEPIVATLHYRNSQRRFVAALPAPSGRAG
jgi:Arc/MetJ family transcription regulator